MNGLALIVVCILFAVFAVIIIAFFIRWIFKIDEIVYLLESINKNMKDEQ